MGVISPTHHPHPFSGPEDASFCAASPLAFEHSTRCRPVGKIQWVAADLLCGLASLEI